MTCIVGYVAENGDMWMGADSAATSGWDLTIRRSPKVFVKEKFIFGVTGYARMQQILQYVFSPPTHPEDMDTEEYMCTLFVDALRDAMKGVGYARKDSEQERVDSLTLVGYRGRLFLVEGNYQITEAVEAYAATGCGEAYSLGVMYALTQEDTIEQDPEAALRMALEASERFSSGVRAPFHIVCLTQEPPSDEVDSEYAATIVTVEEKISEPVMEVVA